MTMHLADEILAARGTDIDVGDLLTDTSTEVLQAQRFELREDVTMAALNLVRPSSLVEMRQFCRLPHPQMWIEWQPVHEDVEIKQSFPRRFGCLLNAIDHDLQMCFATWAWVHEKERERLVFVCPIEALFDWHSPSRLPDLFPEQMNLSSLDPKQLSDDLRSARCMNKWKQHANSGAEIQSLIELTSHTLLMASPLAGKFLKALEKTEPDRKGWVPSWLENLRGEPAFIRAVITLLNCKNGVTHEPNDLTKLNRARMRRGKAQLLDFVTTRLVLSAAQQRHAEAQGISRQAARQHLVRGHLKNIRGNLYWWSPHLRGDPLRPVPRRGYDVRMSGASS
jgi:hypothetical protein